MYSVSFLSLPRKRMNTEDDTPWDNAVGDKFGFQTVQMLV